MPKTKHTKTQQRNIVNNVFSLVRKGHSVTEARKTIANEIGEVQILYLYGNTNSK